ncbi:hypothetical protein GSU68_00395 [Rathayibacter sp. VKM Ac-2759]|uniref:glycosyl hydrolase family 28-related protein n=2 Tax=Rathayibacter TaxID=33886 RepID=UPI001317EAEC|nr:glycosyl hydrolase family 28-related protein [Rathayibacter sp. VKM Ac-2759]QHC65178.1 hypothetical protein GSU68_00395 [Rathayibacter sp. VKM Ac-2759]
MPLLSAAAAELSRRGLFAAPLGATLATTDPDSPVLHSEIAAPSGVAGLDASGVVPLAQLPEAVLTGSGERPVAKGELVYNVQDYGATGDGSTDDLPAIDAAIDAALATYGGVVYFPRGIYRIAGSIGRASGLASIAFRGAGELSTRIRSLTDAPVVTGAFSACRFDNLILDANDLGSPCISAHLDKTVLDSLQLYGWTDYGMRLNDGTFGDLGLLNRIQRCSIDQCTGTGIWTGYRMIDSWIVENNIGASYADLSIEGGPIRILGNHLDGSPQINIELRGNRRITIANNIMEGARRQSLVYTMPPWLTEDLAQIQIVGNAISNGGKAAANTYPAIAITGVSPTARTVGFSITGNIFACEDAGAGWTHCVEAVNARAVSVLGNQWATGHMNAKPVRAVGSTAYEVIGNHGDNAVKTT